MDRKLLTLERSGVARGYSKSQLRMVARLADLVELPPRQTLICAGDRRTGCYWLLGGSVVTATGDSMWLTSQAGMFVGLAETLLDAQASADTVVLCETRALAFTRGAIRAALDDVEPLRREAVAQLAAASLYAIRRRSEAALALD